LPEFFIVLFIKIPRHAVCEQVLNLLSAGLGSAPTFCLGYCLSHHNRE